MGAAADVLPHPLQVAGWQLPGLLTELTEEVDRRQKSPENDGPSIYLLIYGLHRFRDLSRAKTISASAGKRSRVRPSNLRRCCVKGRDFRVHTLAWSTGTICRARWKMIRIRVLFQMSAGDSSKLIDSPAASKLGRIERRFKARKKVGWKVPPYGWPTKE